MANRLLVGRCLRLNETIKMTYSSPEPEPTVPLPASRPEPDSGYPVPYDYPSPPAGFQPYGNASPAPYPPGHGPTAYPGPPGYGYPVDPRQQAYRNGLYAAQKSRIAAGLLALFLGCLGVHSFYLGRTGIGVLQLLLTVLSLGLLAPLVAVWVLIEGILILVRSPSFATDARGIPLRD